MALTTVGFDGTVTELQWAKLWDALSSQPERVSGMAASPATGTRLVDVATGWAACVGTRVDSSAVESVTLDANASGNPRIDYIVAEVDWALNTVDVKAVKGATSANPSPPGLTRNPGVLWQIPLARVRVNSGVGQLLASHITDARPTDPVSKLYTGTANTVFVGNNETKNAFQPVTVTDPGWPYRVQVSGAVHCSSTESAIPRAAVHMDGSEIGITQCRADQANGTATIPTWTSAIQSEKDTAIEVKISRLSNTASGSMQVTDFATSLQVVVIPA